MCRNYAWRDKKKDRKRMCSKLIRVFLLDRSILVLDATVDERRQGVGGILGSSRIFSDGEVLEKIIQNLKGLGVFLSRSHLESGFSFFLS